ncbi:hypothetical protein CHU98_g8434 [Xylaria longipes]|nr:hypothetical protein CHU98_g8434 [Xylaria longipes]
MPKRAREGDFLRLRPHVRGKQSIFARAHKLDEQLCSDEMPLTKAIYLRLEDEGVVPDASGDDDSDGGHAWAVGLRSSAPLAAATLKREEAGEQCHEDWTT